MMKFVDITILRFRLLLAAVFSILFLSASLSHANGIPEYKLKAAYLFNVMKFVSWNEENQQQKKLPIILCVYKNNPFGNYLSPWESKKIQNREVKILQPESIQAIKQCHVVFIYQQPTDNIIDTLKTLPVLTISDNNKFIEQDGMVQLKTSKQKLRIVINLPQVKKHKLSVSSRLLGASMVDIHE